MDFRFQTLDGAREFHRRRTAFVILDGEVIFLPKVSGQSHYEFCKDLGIDKDRFRWLTRGYYLDGNLVFYKDNFIYDEELICEALEYLGEIVDSIDVSRVRIYFGQVPEENFRLDFYYGDFDGNVLIKSDSK